MTTNSPPRCSNSMMTSATSAGSFVGAEIILLDAGNFPGFSNYLNETWTFTGTTSNWTDQSTALVNANGPLPGRVGGVMAFDGTNVMMYGGQGTTGVPLNDTWVWSGTTWTQKTGPGLALAGPYVRMNAEACNLTNVGGGHAGVVMFSGQNLLANLVETWAWDGVAQTWAQVSVTNGVGPAGRTGHCFASNGTTAVLFGGQGTNQQFNDTWTYTTASGWAQAAIVGTSPSVRSNACMTYNTATSQWVMFGGENEYGYLDETWVLNAGATAWTQVTAGNGVGPAGRINAMMAYDAVTLAQTVMFGGQTATAGYAVNETWAFNGTVWTQL